MHQVKNEAECYTLDLKIDRCIASQFKVWINSWFGFQIRQMHEIKSTKVWSDSELGSNPYSKQMVPQETTPDCHSSSSAAQAAF